MHNPMHMETKWWLIILSILLGIDLLIHIFLFFFDRSGYRIDIPTALGIQVSLISLLIIVGGFILAFFGSGRLDEIERRAISNATTEAKTVAVNLLTTPEGLRSLLSERPSDTSQAGSFKTPSDESDEGSA